MVRLLWGLGLWAACLLVGMAYYLRDLQPPLVAAQLTFSRDAFEAVLSTWSAEGIRRFSQHFGADYVFLVAYGAFGWLLGRRLAVRNAPGAQVLPWLLPVAGVLDFVENVLHQIFVGMRPLGTHEVLYFVAGGSALFKFVLVLAFALLAVHAWRRNRP